MGKGSRPRGPARNGAQNPMPDRTEPARTPGSAVRRPRVLERLVVVAAVAAVLVAVGAWYAMNRPDGTAEAARASAAADTADGSFSETSGTPDQATAGTGDQAAATAGGSASGPARAAAPSAGASAGTVGSRTTAASPSTAARSTAGTAPLSPTTAFLTQLAASGLGPPVDDAAKLSMADDVCQELKNGSKYADVVRALTFSGANDEQAANFARLAIKNLCPKFPVG